MRIVLGLPNNFPIEEKLADAFFAGAANTPKDLVDIVERRAGDKKVKVLRLFAHGSVSDLCFLDGGDLDLRFNKQKNEWRLVTEEGVDAEDQLIRLRDNFAPGAKVHISACDLAYGERGELFIKRLSKLWNVEVHAGDTIQNPFMPGYEGREVIAKPNGAISYKGRAQPKAIYNLYPG